MTAVGRPVALWCSATDLDDLRGYQTSPGGARFPLGRTTTRPQVALAMYDNAVQPEDVVVVEEMPSAHPLVQRLPDGDYLVVGGRCWWSEEGPEKNALVIGTDGAIKRRGTLGDGIEHLLVDERGDIWAGYFDEGIFGNFGWGGPGPEPLGAAGLVKWSSDLEKSWEYAAADDYWFADCYALNVAADRVLACSYSEFPIIEVRDEDAVVRRTVGLEGASGILVDGDRVAVLGSYKDKAALRVGSIGDTTRFKRSSLRLGRGTKPAVGSTLVCRGSVAHLFVGPNWFTFDLSSVAT